MMWNPFCRIGVNTYWFNVRFARALDIESNDACLDSRQGNRPKKTTSAAV
ncbi:MAG TPA: hypothetical protein PK468_21075 [Candidatus Hydrogenedentes bacterium]|nr:hypothetical protein [Candidatus Hydrogenedentota bacterium]